MLAAAFIGQGTEALLHPSPAVDPSRASRDGPLARLAAATQIGGGLLLASGRLPRVAAAALAATVAANLGANAFRSQAGPEVRDCRPRDVLVDVSLLGGLIIAAADTGGKPSLGWRGRRAASRVAEVVSTAAAPGADSITDRVREGGERLATATKSEVKRLAEH